MADEEVSGVVSLIDAPVVEGYEIKEWSIKQFSLLYPYLKEVVEKLQSQGATLDNAHEYLQENFMILVDAFIPVLPEILAISLRLKPNEIDDIPAAKASVLGLAILKRNTEHLTSFLAQARGSLGEQVQTQPTT